MDRARSDKLIRRTAMIGAVTAAYFLLTTDYSPNYNALQPVKKAMESAENSFKRAIFGTSKEAEKTEEEHKYSNAKQSTD